MPDLSFRCSSIVSFGQNGTFNSTGFTSYVIVRGYSITGETPNANESLDLIVGFPSNATDSVIGRFQPLLTFLPVVYEYNCAENSRFVFSWTGSGLVVIPGTPQRNLYTIAQNHSYRMERVL